VRTAWLFDEREGVAHVGWQGFLDGQDVLPTRISMVR
jgi:hypothetical protein